MPGARTRRTTRPLPPPLPPAERTIGQLIGEAIRAYGSTFARALPLGVVVAGVNQLTIGLDRLETTAVLLAAGPVFTLEYAYATRLVLERPVPVRAWLVALAVGTAVWIPAALLFPWFALAAVLWLAAFGLSVPAAMAEGTSVLGSVRRGLQLGRVDYIHAAGALATLVILFFLTRLGLALLLDSQADNTVRVAVFLADTVLAPLLFLGSALLYVDQEARLRSPDDRRKERDADVPDAVDPHREGGADAPRQSRPPA
jgi:hypothetical protein